MQKILKFGLALAICASFIACGDDDTTTGATGDTTDPTAGMTCIDADPTNVYTCEVETCTSTDPTSTVFVYKIDGVSYTCDTSEPTGQGCMDYAAALLSCVDMTGIQ